MRHWREVRSLREPHSARRCCPPATPPAAGGCPAEDGSGRLSVGKLRRRFSVEVPTAARSVGVATDTGEGERPCLETGTAAPSLPDIRWCRAGRPSSVESTAHLFPSPGKE